MKILAINGSPRGTQGLTWHVLERFIKGMQEAQVEVETIQLAGKKIHHCTGELACWLKTPGQCIHKDDMEEILASMKGADAAVIATPVYVDGMTGLLKNCLDRMVPIADPHFEIRDGHLRHAAREGSPKRIALVSVCGFWELENFDPLVAHMQAICRNMNAEYAGAVLRPAAPMMPYAKLLHPFKMHAVNKAFEKAGLEFARAGKISGETAAAASAEIISRESYIEQGNKYFDKELAKIK
ncbi:MAG: NAD(P)H-dependent oxidoreductase [bacterium]